MGWFRPKQKATAYLHFIEAHRNSHGDLVRGRWHVDICDADTDAVLFVPSPRGYPSLIAARAAVRKLGSGVRVVVGDRPRV